MNSVREAKFKLKYNKRNSIRTNCMNLKLSKDRIKRELCVMIQPNLYV